MEENENKVLKYFTREEAENLLRIYAKIALMAENLATDPDVDYTLLTKDLDDGKGTVDTKEGQEFFVKAFDFLYKTRFAIDEADLIIAEADGRLHHEVN